MFALWSGSETSGGRPEEKRSLVLERNVLLKNTNTVFRFFSELKFTTQQLLLILKLSLENFNSFLDVNYGTIP